jgi:WhiB family redox-sensing transcriptional regulator
MTFYSDTHWYSARRPAHGPERFTHEQILDQLDAQPWRIDAICNQTDPDAFFPDKGESSRAAKRVCAGCPVREACLNYALVHQERFGVWGGLSERERRKLAGTVTVVPHERRRVSSS